MLARMHAAPPDWITPAWPAPPGVYALCTTRVGGVSAAPWNTCNLGDHVRDDPQAVRANRARLGDALRHTTPAARAVYLKQVHATQVAVLDTTSADGLQADASTTRTPGLACTVLVADCLPVLFTNRAGTRVAAAHAGWRGLAAGVLERTLACFVAPAQWVQAPSAPEIEVLAWLGPCIGPTAFEVGAEVREAFCAHDARAARCFAPLATRGKYLADLAALARQRLQAAGVASITGNDSSSRWCTVSNPSRFFSHRRDAATLGSTGRMAACVWIGA